MSTVFSTPLTDVPTGCGTCPDVIIGLIAKDAIEMRDKVRRAKRVVTAVNRYAHYASNLLIDELEKLLRMIPEPPYFDLRFIVGAVGCPLTPQAMVIEHFDKAFAEAQKAAAGLVGVGRQSAFWDRFMAEMADMQALAAGILERPRDILVKFIRIIEGFANQLNELKEHFMDELAGVDRTGFLRLAYRLAGELRDTFRDADQYILKVAVTTGSVALVKATCPSLYNRQDLPFKAFDAEISNFSHDGIIPSGFDGEAARIMSLFMQIEAKIARWRSASMFVTA